MKTNRTKHTHTHTPQTKNVTYLYLYIYIYLYLTPVLFSAQIRSPANALSIAYLCSEARVPLGPFSQTGMHTSHAEGPLGMKSGYGLSVGRSGGGSDRGERLAFGRVVTPSSRSLPV